MSSTAAQLDPRDTPVLTSGRNWTGGAERLPIPEARRSGQPTKVWVLSTVHQPDDARIFWKQAVSLASAGYEVNAIFWTGNASASSDKEVAGVRRRILWKGNAKSGLHQRLSVILQTLRLCLQSASSNFLIHDPELIPVGMILVMAGRKVIYDAHEDLPTQVLHKAYLSPWQQRLAQGMAKALVRCASRWLTGQLCATTTVQLRFPNRSCLVRNFPLLNEFNTPRGVNRSGQIVYVGGLAPSRGVLEVIKAVNKLESSSSLILAGPWESEAFRIQCEQADALKRVTYLGMLDRRGIAKLLAQSDIGVAVLHPVPAYVDALPVKLFEYMAAGLPVIVSDFPLWRGIVGSASCGVLVEPRDVEALSVAFDYLLKNPEVRKKMGTNGRTAVERRYTWETESSQFLSFVGITFGIPTPTEHSEPLALPA